MNIARLFPWARLLAQSGAGLALALVLLAGHAGVGTGGTGSYAQGRLTTVKPLVLNNISYDTGSAQVYDDDGNLRSINDLQPGMTAQIDSTVVRFTANGATATASRITYGADLLGPLAAMDTATGVLNLLGQSVVVDADTVLDSRLAGGLNGLAVGQLLQVYADWDPASGSYKASRLEPADGATAFKLRGVVAALDPNARVLHVGGAEFAYTGATGVPANLAVGNYVKMNLQPAAATTTRWTVTSFSSATAAPADGREGHLEGLISSFTSTAAFSVNGQPVTTDGASFPDGTAAIVPGALVEVEGTFQGGVLRATQVGLGSWSDDGVEYEGQGAISSVNAATGTFVLRGKTISTSRSDLRWVGGTPADLKARKRVEVQGLLSSDRQHVDATVIQFDN
jgi:hypothetical protein